MQFFNVIHSSCELTWHALGFKEQTGSVKFLGHISVLHLLVCLELRHFKDIPLVQLNNSLEILCDLQENSAWSPYFFLSLSKESRYAKAEYTKDFVCLLPMWRNSEYSQETQQLVYNL